MQLLQGFRLIESQLSLPDIPGNRSDGKQGSILSNSKIVFTYDDPLVGTIKIIELYFQNKDKVYILSLHSGIRNYDSYLPIIKRIHSISPKTKPKMWLSKLSFLYKENAIVAYYGVIWNLWEPYDRLLPSKQHTK